jgi:hypothetical protein
LQEEHLLLVAIAFLMLVIRILDEEPVLAKDLPGVCDIHKLGVE